MATTTSSSSHRPPLKPLDLEITIVSAKHLKNVNWRNGDLNPYVIFWLDPDRRLATKSDDSNSTKPIWNERFLIPIPIPSSPSAAVLTLEIFHSKPSDTPKPLIGTLRLPIEGLPNPEDSTTIRIFDLRRPSGRPCGKIRLKLAIRDRPLPDYQITHPPAYYYANAPPPSYGRYPPYNTTPSLPPPLAATPPPPPPLPPPRPYHYGSYSSDPYSGYYQGGYYSQPPPSPAPRPYTGYGDGGGSVVGGPSAPVDYAQYEQKQKPGKAGSGGGLGMEVGVGAVTGGVAGLAIDEQLRYHDEKIGEKVESDLNARELDDYSGYRRVDY